jgi:hypothetical protein
MTTQPYNQPAKAGWYPDPSGTPRQRFFNGMQWTDVYDDFGGAPANDAKDPAASKQTAISLGVIVLGIVGLVMSMQSTSLMNGTGTIWLGVAIAAVALAASFFLSGATWVKVVASILLAIALFSALYMEHQMTEKRTEISQMLSSSYRS